MRKPIEGHIRSEHTYALACIIVDGQRVGGHDDLASALVEIGFAPTATSRCHGGCVPLHGVVAVGIGTQLLILQLAVVSERVG